MIWKAVRGEAAPLVKKPVELHAPFRQGFLTNALNPKVAIFYLAVLPQFASGPDAPVIGVMLIAIHYVLGAAWLSFVAYAASRARRIALKTTFVRWLEGAVGVFFVGVAGRLALAQR
jgi:threonine/homoserine/homoserine lactone efflux protein